MKLSWRSLEYIYTEKTNDWYWIVAIITITIALISIILNNLIFGLLIIVSSFTLSLFASRRPEIIHIEIDNRRIHVDKIFYNFADLDSFWVDKELGKLTLKSKRFFLPYTTILIDEVSPDEIREALLPHIEEVEHVEPLFEKILLYLGF